jgi:hypothetical protein
MKSLKQFPFPIVIYNFIEKNRNIFKILVHLNINNKYKMSGTLNKVMLIGHLGDEVKMHYFEGGNCIGRFPLATNETYINKLQMKKLLLQNGII